MKFIVWRVIRAEVVVIAVVGALCLILGWRSADEITLALWAAGVLILAGGCADMVAGRSESRHLEYHYARTATHTLSDEERLRQDKQEMRQSGPLLLQGLLLGGLTIGIAFAIDALAG